MITINKWSEVFENADSRKRQRLGYYYAPSGCDSSGYLALVSEFDPAEAWQALGIFMALCQQAATMRKDVRGKFVNSSGEPMSVSQVAMLIRCDKSILEKSLKILSDERVKWVSASDVPPTCQPPADNVPENSGFVQGQGQGQGQDKGQGQASVETPAIAWSPTGGFTGISDLDREEWNEAYPACDIDRQLAVMSQWLKSNPAKAKKKQWRRFITNWLGRAQEKGGDIPTNKYNERNKQPTNGRSRPADSSSPSGGAGAGIDVPFL